MDGKVGIIFTIVSELFINQLTLYIINLKGLHTCPNEFIQAGFKGYPPVPNGTFGRGIEVPFLTKNKNKILGSIVQGIE